MALTHICGALLISHRFQLCIRLGENGMVRRHNNLSNIVLGPSTCYILRIVPLITLFENIRVAWRQCSTRGIGMAFLCSIDRAQRWVAHERRGKEKIIDISASPNQHSLSWIRCGSDVKLWSTKTRNPIIGWNVLGWNPTPPTSTPLVPMILSGALIKWIIHRKFSFWRNLKSDATNEAFQCSRTTVSIGSDKFLWLLE